MIQPEPIPEHARIVGPVPPRASFSMRITELALRLRGKRPLDPALLRTKPRDAAPPTWFRARYHLSKREVQGRAILTAGPQTHSSHRHTIYLHGGGYVWPLIRPHWWVVHRLIQATGGGVSVPLYPLAPESDYRDAFAFLLAVWAEVVRSEPETAWILAGDSAGGGLALGLSLKFREARLPLPSRLILFSPWLDLKLADPAALEVEAQDAMLTVAMLRRAGKLWANGEDPSAPHLSPLHADLYGLPPIQLFQGSHDILVVDARTFARRAEAAGHPVQYIETPGGIHIYMAATWTPESRDAFRQIGASVRSEQFPHSGKEALNQPC